ncbi:amidohydrolase family protein [Lichenibacterium ramalinae]|nr:amidohydrolase family protein [Lichenibacterium ramalinae]
MTSTQPSTMVGPAHGEHRRGLYIDVHAHVFPDFYEAAMAAAGVYDVDGWPNPKWSPEAMIEVMDEHRIEAQVLSVSSPGVTFADGRDAARLARRLNEYMAGLVHDHSPRLGSMAVLPLPDVQASLAEIAYALDELGMDGVGLLSNYRGLYLGDHRIDPVLAELNRRKATVFVHPTIPPHWDSFTIDIPAPVLEYTFDSTRMAERLVASGSKAKFADIALIVAHGGATLPLSHQRLVKYWMDGKNDIFDTFYFELTATTEHEQIDALMAMAKPSRCMMGFDFPFMKPDWFDALQANLESYRFSPEDLHAVMRDNALRLFPKVRERLR